MPADVFAVFTEVESDHEALPDRFSVRPNRLRPTEQLRRLAQLWPTFDDDERALLATHLHRLRESASA